MSDYKNSDRKIKVRSKLFVLFVMLLLVASGGITFSDIGEAPAEAGGADANSADASGDQSVEAAGVSVDQRIPLINFEKNMSIIDAVRVLAGLYRKNIVPSPGVDGVLAFRTLRNVTFDEAMDAVLGGRFEYEQKGNLIEVYPKEDESRMKYEVFALYYITAEEAMKLIGPILSSKGTIGTTSAAETGVPIGESISAQTGGGDTMSLRDTIVVYDYAENIKKAREIITAIDVRPKQVLIEATIFSATLTEDTQFGIDWQSLKGTAVASLSSIGPGAPDYFKSNGTQLGGATAVSGGLTVGLSLGDVGAFIQAVEQVTDVTILANPKILAVNKQLGQVYIGDKVGYREGDTFDAQGNRVEGQVSFLDTGTKLVFRPYISAQGYIRMDIHAKNSKDASSGGVPSESSTELASNIMVKDGGTIVIGGLFQDTIESKKTQIPLLGDLPIIGAIFRGTSDQNVRKEVVVLLTPHIIEEPGQTNGEARAEDVSRKRSGTREELQWIGRAKLAEDRYAKAVKYYIEGDSEAALREVNLSLQLRPTYLEAIRLKERIISEEPLENGEEIERIMLESVEQEDTDKWLRR